jgi:hypothetical protein
MSMLQITLPEAANRFINRWRADDTNLLAILSSSWSKGRAFKRPKINWRR